MNLTKVTSLTLASLLFCSLSLAQSYTNVSGSAFDFTDIVETSGGGLFGQPVPDSGDLSFPLTNFSAEGVDGAIDFLNGMLELDGQFKQRSGIFAGQS